MASFLERIKDIAYNLPNGGAEQPQSIEKALKYFVFEKGERALFATGLGVARGMDKGTIKGVEVEVLTAVGGYIASAFVRRPGVRFLGTAGVYRHFDRLGDAGLMTAAYRIGASWGGKRAGR